jgi:hypothetical protein
MKRKAACPGFDSASGYMIRFGAVKNPPLRSDSGGVSLPYGRLVMSAGAAFSARSSCQWPVVAQNSERGQELAGGLEVTDV